MNGLPVPSEVPAQTCISEHSGRCGRLQLLRECDFPFWNKSQGKNKKEIHLFLYDNPIPWGLTLLAKGAE